MGVLTALAILAGLILVHEAGHFFAATWQGIRVSGFSIGFGPALIQRRRRGVLFALRAIPLGGFVSFPDDEEDSSIAADDPDLMGNRPLHQRALVIAAGVIANLLLAWSVLLAQGLVLGIPSGFSATPAWWWPPCSPARRPTAPACSPAIASWRSTAPPWPAARTR